MLRPAGGSCGEPDVGPLRAGDLPAPESSLGIEMLGCLGTRVASALYWGNHWCSWKNSWKGCLSTSVTGDTMTHSYPLTLTALRQEHWASSGRHLKAFLWC